jgi:hypothetical protein
MIRLNRIKTGVEHRTFIGRDAITLLREYLKPRMPLRNENPLFTKLARWLVPKIGTRPTIPK